MPQRLPIDAAFPRYRVATNLGETQFVLDVHWNGRAEAWYLDLATEDGAPIRSGMKIVLGALLGIRSRDPRMPDGVLVASDLSGEGRDATLDDLGSRVVVFFYPSSEL
jgi:hypothetical protein